jgi:sugar phosphate isomerase/epimerase
MRTALHSVSYAGVWPGQARLSLDDFLDRAARLGFDAVVLMARRPHLSVLDFDPEARRKLRGKLEALDLRVACLAGYTDFCMGHDRADIPEYKGYVACETCSPLQGGGGEANLDRCARRFLEYVREF